MSSNAIESQGTKFYVGDVGSPDNKQAVPEIKTLGGPDGQATLIDVSDLDSTGKEWKPGLKDEGQITLGMMYIPTNAVHAILRDAFSDRTLKSFRIEFSNGTTWDFNGYVTGFAANNGVDEVNMANVTVKVTGSITES